MLAQHGGTKARWMQSRQQRGLEVAGDVLANPPGMRAPVTKSCSSTGRASSSHSSATDRSLRRPAGGGDTAPQRQQ